MGNDSKTEAPVKTLVEFLKARLDEDIERLQWTTMRGSWKPHRNYNTGERGLVKHASTDDTLASFTYPADAEHACYWQPSRVAEEIAAKQKLVDWAVGYMEGDYAPWNELALRIMAQPYADHEDFRTEWLEVEE